MLMAATFLFACDKKLDVLPQDNITPDQIKTSEDVKAVLYGGYSLYQNANGFGERYLIASDLLASAEQVDFVGTFIDYRDLAGKTQIETNAIANGLWGNGYALINTMNTVLDKIDIVNEDERSTVEAEAKFLRGVAYFELVNFFALPYAAGNTSSNAGVPIVLDPVYSFDESVHKPSRATVEEVYLQIIADLSDAAENLPAEADAAGRATSFAAEAFLSRVYMQMGDYTNAATMANNVIASEAFGIISNYENCFNNDGYSAEDVFAILQTSQSNAGTTNNGLPTFYASQPVGRGDAQVSFDYFNYFEAGDVRGNFVYEGVSISGFPGYYTGKFQTIYKTIPVIRLAEMYLTRGEANRRKGGAPIGGASPLQDINEVRNRAGASALNTVVPNDFVDERFRELGFEGDRLWTLKRLQMDVDGLPFNDPLLVLPIPQREIDVNENLVQNPGY